MLKWGMVMTKNLYLIEQPGAAPLGSRNVSGPHPGTSFERDWSMCFSCFSTQFGDPDLRIRTDQGEVWRGGALKTLGKRNVSGIWLWEQIYGHPSTALTGPCRQC